jgi:hypothetical protein
MVSGIIEEDVPVHMVRPELAVRTAAPVHLHVLNAVSRVTLSQIDDPRVCLHAHD